MKKHFTCPVCEFKKTSFCLSSENIHGNKVLGKEKFDYYQCSRCDAIFLVNEKFDARYYKKYYPNEYRETNNIAGNLEKRLIDFSNSKKRGYINKFYRKKHSKKVRLLDIGTGNGAFLKSFGKDSQYELHGTEIYELKTKDKTYKIHTLNFLKDPIKKLGKFDIVTLWHVIEHLPNPNRFFKQLNMILPKNGLLVVSTPNTNSYGFRRGGKNWFHFDAPRHIVLYNYKTIRYLAEKYNYDILEIKNNFYDFPTDLYWSLRGSHTIFTFLFYPLLKFRSRETVTYVLRKRS